MTIAKGGWNNSPTSTLCGVREDPFRICCVRDDPFRSLNRNTSEKMKCHEEARTRTTSYEKQRSNHLCSRFQIAVLYRLVLLFFVVVLVVGLVVVVAVVFVVVVIGVLFLVICCSSACIYALVTVSNDFMKGKENIRKIGRTSICWIEKGT